MTPRAPRWTAPEIDYLEQYAGQVPFPDLVYQMHRKAMKHGWPVRSAVAIRKWLNTRGQHVGCRHGEWMTYSGVGDLLNCSSDRVANWARTPEVRAILEPRWRGKAWFTSRDSWRRLARKMPRILGGFSADALFLLLEDRDLAEQVAAAHRSTLGDWRIRCIETGEIYENCSAAARRYHLNRSTINRAIHEGRPVASIGLTFEQLRQPTDNS